MKNNYDDFLVDALPQSAYFDGVLSAAGAEATDSSEPPQETADTTQEETNENNVETQSETQNDTVSDSSSDSSAENETDNQAEGTNASVDTTEETQTTETESDEVAESSANSTEDTETDSSVETEEVADSEEEETETEEIVDSSEVVIIDDSVPDSDQLAADAEDNGHDVIIVSNDDDKSGLEQANEQLEESGKTYAAIHIVTHADNNDIALGGSKINSNNVDEHADELAELGSYLSEDGDILLYGCEIGQDEAFIGQLSQATGADVAASDDITGKDGDWQLEVKSGSVEANVAFSDELQAEYDHNLDAVDTAASGDEDTNITGTITVGNGVVTGNTQAANGTLTIDANGNFVFVPNPNWNGTTSAQYTLSEPNPDASIASYQQINSASGGFTDRESLQVSPDGKYASYVSRSSIKIFTAEFNESSGEYETKLYKSINGDFGDTASIDVTDGTVTVAVAEGFSHTSNKVKIYQFDEDNPTSHTTRTITTPASGYAGEGLFVGDGGKLVAIGVPEHGFAKGDGHVFIYKENSAGNYSLVQTHNKSSAEFFGRSVQGAANEFGGYTLVVGAYGASNYLPAGDVSVLVSKASNPYSFTKIGWDRQGSNGTLDDEYALTTAIDEKNPGYFAAGSYNGGVSIYKINASGSGFTEIIPNFRRGGTEQLTLDFYDGVLAVGERDGKSYFYQFNSSNNTLSHIRTISGGGIVGVGENAVFVSRNVYTPNEITTTADIDFTVRSVNDNPVANDDAYVTDEDVPITVSSPQGLLANDTDIDGDTLTVSEYTQPENGTLVVNDDGSFTYTPNENWHGTETITYQVTDGNVTEEATVTFTVNSVNDAPVGVIDGLGGLTEVPETIEEALALVESGQVSLEDLYLTKEDESLIISAGQGLLANDTDVDGDMLCIKSYTQPEGGTVEVAEDGSFEFIPDANWNGITTFTYIATDKNGGDTEPTTVFIGVEPVNDAPVGVTDGQLMLGGEIPNPDAYVTDEDIPLSVSAEQGLLANDTDVDGDMLCIKSYTQPEGGTVEVAEDGSFVFTPDQDWNGQTTFTYIATDKNGGDTDPVTVHLSVLPVNDAPVANADGIGDDGQAGTADDNYVTFQDTAITVRVDDGVLANDTDVEGDMLCVISYTQTSDGTVEMNEDGSFTFTPKDGYYGRTSFTYTVSDKNGGETTGTVYILVKRVIPDVVLESAAAPAAITPVVEPEPLSTRHVHDTDDNNGDAYLDVVLDDSGKVIVANTEFSEPDATKVHIHLLVNKMNETLEGQTFDSTNTVVGADVDIQAVAAQINKTDSSLTDLVSNEGELTQANSIKTAIEQASIGTATSI